MKEFNIEPYNLDKHWKQIEEYMFDNIEDVKYTALTWFVDKENASYYRPCFVIKSYQDVVWFIYWSFDYSSSSISNLCIFKDYRKKWLWKRLLDEFTRYVKINNQKLITLVCFEKNKDACNFYKSQWFKESWYNNYSSLIEWEWHKWLLFAKEI